MLTINYPIYSSLEEVCDYLNIPVPKKRTWHLVMNKLAQKISSQICVKLQGEVYGPADVDKRKVKWNFEKNSNIPCLSYQAKFIDEFTSKEATLTDHYTLFKGFKSPLSIGTTYIRGAFNTGNIEVKHLTQSVSEIPIEKTIAVYRKRLMQGYNKEFGFYADEDVKEIMEREFVSPEFLWTSFVSNAQTPRMYGVKVFRLLKNASTEYYIGIKQQFPWDYEEFPRNNLNIQGYLTDISGCSTFKSDWIGEHTEDENFYSLED